MAMSLKFIYTAYLVENYTNDGDSNDFCCNLRSRCTEIIFMLPRVIRANQATNDALPTAEITHTIPQFTNQQDVPQGASLPDFQTIRDFYLNLC
jgi:hypothetical protein